MHLSRIHIGLLLALLTADFIILFTIPDWFWLRFPAALVLTFVLPGWAWLSALNWLQTSDAVERLVLIPGFSSVLSALALFIALLLPGPFTEMPNLIALNLATLTGLLWGIVSIKCLLGNPPTSKFPSRTVLMILLAIVAVAAVIWLTRLGYAEFHENELGNMRFIVRLQRRRVYSLPRQQRADSLAFTRCSVASQWLGQRGRRPDALFAGFTFAGAFDVCSRVAYEGTLLPDPFVVIRPFSPWRPGGPSSSRLVSFQGT